MANSQYLGHKQMDLCVPGQSIVMEPVVDQLHHSASQICCIPAANSERCTAPRCQDAPPMHSVAHSDPAFQYRKCVQHMCMWCKLLTYLFNMQSTHRMENTKQHTVTQSVSLTQQKKHYSQTTMLSDVSNNLHAIADCTMKSKLKSMPWHNAWQSQSQTSSYSNMHGHTEACSSR